MSRASFSGVSLSAWAPSPTTRNLTNTDRIWSGIRCWRSVQVAVTFRAAAKDNGFRVSGVELSRAHREYVLGRWGIEVFGDPVEQDKIPAESFDNIVNFNCLEHIPNPAEHLRGMSRTVRPPADAC